MNAEMRMKLGLLQENATGCQFENVLTVGSKIFYQTHFYPLIKMQNSVREIYLVFKGINGSIPMLLNVEVKHSAKETEIICCGMEISNRNRYEKELLVAKKAAEEALTENAELKRFKNTLVEQQKVLENQYRKLKSLKEQQQEVFKLIAHDLQEPLRKSIFISNYILTKNVELPHHVKNNLGKIVSFNSQMSDMLLTLLRFKELEDVKPIYSKIDLNDIIKAALNDLNLPDDNQLAIAFPVKNSQLYADKRLLTRFFAELLKNSLNDKNPKLKTLSVDISAIETVKNSFFELSDKYHYENFIKITVTDNGLGYKTKISEIIQKSVQFDKINIGLAYCKKIIEKHSGSIDAKFIEGKGVSYTILLPQRGPAKEF